MKPGQVYLAGAGPGDEKLISIKAWELIQKADVIVYDRLACEKLLEYKKEDCELIYVGKMPDKHTLNQSEINEILIKKAKENKRVLRLKGGDPFIFGRGAEEAQSLKENGVIFEIVPGISSFYSAPAYEGIPVTHRKYASSFHVFTGHKEKEEELDFKLISGLKGTLIFLMGMKHLSVITQKLMEYKSNKNTPVAVIHWGTTAKQKAVTGTLESIVSVAEKENIGNPSVIIIGDVVKIREEIQWQNNRPLWKKRILITKSLQEAKELSDLFADAGGETVMLPLMNIETAQYCCTQKDMEKYNWIIFTSKNGVNSFFEILKNNNIDIRTIWRAKLFCIGEGTKKALEQKGLFADAMPKESNTVSMTEKLKEIILPGDAVLFPASSLINHSVKESVELAGGICDTITAYSNKPNEKIPYDITEEMKQKKYDAIVFSSASQVQYYKKYMDTQTGGAKLCAIGNTTAKAASQLGFSVDCIAKGPMAQDIFEAVLSVLK